MSLDVAAVRAAFPILSRTVRGGNTLIYLDSGATSHNPVQVLDAERAYNVTSNAAAHRGAHLLGEEATDALEHARARVAAFIGADPGEIVFTRNATEAANLIAYSISNAATGAPSGGPATGSPLVLGPGDEVLITELEHHANLVPWQQLCQRTGATLRWFPVTGEGRVDLSDIGTLVSERTKVVAVTGQSNVTGAMPPVETIAAAAHAVGAIVVVDAAQSVPHHPVRVGDSGADLLYFSGHKMLAPTGVRALWGRRPALASIPPFITGGSLLRAVRMQASTSRPPAHRRQHGQPAADPVEVAHDVRREEHGGPPCDGARHRAQELAARRGVQARGRLVEEPRRGRDQLVRPRQGRRVRRRPGLLCRLKPAGGRDRRG